MQDKFIYENFYSYVFETATSFWKISINPVSSTNVLALSISYIAVENTYNNFFVKPYTYGTETGLTSGSGSRSHTATYNFSTEFTGHSLNSDFTKNKITVSWTGFYISTTKDVDIYLNSYMMNTSYYTISMSTTVNNYWYRLNVMACIINVGEFPTIVKWLMGNVVLSVSNTVQRWTEFEAFANVSYCFGYTGINANTTDSQDMYWAEFNTTSIKATLSLLTFARYSYIFLWN